jgi:branched-subunit amino acid transport protein
MMPSMPSLALQTWLLIGLAILATYLWRGLGVVLSTRIDPTGSTFRWVSCVSYAMLAGLVARMTVLPVGALAATPLTHRLVAMACGFAFFALSRRSVLVGVTGGTALFAVLSALSVP